MVPSVRRLLSPDSPHSRRGVFFVLAIISLIAAMTFVGFSVDLGMITVTKTRMQASADAASLAAAQEIVVAVRLAAESGQTDMLTVQSLAADRARSMAQHVSELNGFYIDPASDVSLGRRMLSEDGLSYTESWNAPPYNMVRVQVRKDNPDATARDARLPLMFAPVAGNRSQAITASATAFIESRDIVAVLDYSGSMAYDSLIDSGTVSRLGLAAVENSLDDIWNTLSDSGVTFSNAPTIEKFPDSGFGEIRSANGGYRSSSDVTAVFTAQKLDQGGTLGYVPFPQEGKNTGTGRLLGVPSRTLSRTRWREYIQFVMQDSTLQTYGYRKKYCYRTLMHYLISQRMQNHYSEDLWRAPIYPHHALKEGMSLFTSFLDDLGYGDHVGLVTYATTSRVQTGLWDDGVGVTVDLGNQHLSDDYAGIDAIQRHKQPGHYDRSTGIGYGLEDGIDLIAQQGRYGAQKAILLMTDGQSNQYPSGFGTDDLPDDWDWNEITDFDGDGTADFVINQSYGGWDSNWRASLYAFMKAVEARDAGIVIHTISVGAGADTQLMQAIADTTGGYSLSVPGGTSVQQMEEDLEAAFAVLAGRVPPARLMNGDE